MLKTKLFCIAVALPLAGAAACGPGPDEPAPAPDAGLADGLSPELRLVAQASLDHLEARAAALGLRGRGDLQLARAFEDDLGLAHARFQQTLDGVPVFGGEGIVHLGRDRAVARVTDAFVPGIAVRTTPTLTPGEAIDLALPPGASLTGLATPPAADLWAMRHQGRDRLVWRVALRLDEGTNRISLPVVFIDAHDGALVWQYDNLQTGAGQSLYSGEVTLDTTPHAGLYYLEDVPRRLGTFDMRNGSTMHRFEDDDDVWDTQRAGLDAQFGALKTYEYWKNVHGRNGIDGNGGPGSQPSVGGATTLITSRVHYGTSYNNAFWDGTRMTYGDGDGVTFSPLVSLDVAGHEMMHGITQSTAGLVYAGESGALNESYSDIFGAMVERYARGDSEAIWKIGDECYTPDTPGDALRHMDAPHQASNKGYTADDDPDHYSERYTGGGDNGGVHINSGIANKTFYLLAMGGAHHLGGAMTGIGPDKAAAIWYRALTTYMTSSTTFVQAGRATYDAAVTLHGEGSPEAAAVVTAWGLTGIVVDLAAPEVAITAPAPGAELSDTVTVTATATDDIGVTAVELRVDGALVATDTAAPYSLPWDTSTVADGPHTLTVRALDPSGNAGESAPVAITVNNADVTAPVTAITSPAPGATVSGTRTVYATATDDVGVIAVELLVDGALVATDTTSTYTLPWNTTTVPNGAHTLQTRARDAAGNVGLSAPVTVTVANIDATPPATSITSPAAGATVTGAIEVAAAASDNVGISKVDLYIDGALAMTSTSTAPPYTFAWDTAGKPNGDHTLRTRAYDTSGNSAYSATITVTVSNVDTTPPAVAITSPAEGAILSGTKTVSTTATDVHGVTAVELYVDGVKVATDTTSPYNISWNTSTVPNGPRVLQSRALDPAGNAGVSAPVTVTVNNPDVTNPTTAITSPATGAQVSGTITVTTSSSDNVGVVAVELLVDGNVVDTATSAPWSFTWDTRTVANKTHTLRTRARDAAGNTGQSGLASITVDNGIGAAVFDPELQAPRCAVGYDGCDTGTLVNGRAGLGPEPNTPNTIGDSCWDGGAGGYHASSSIDRLRVYTADGTALAYGKTVIIEATVWNLWNLLEGDVIDLYYTTSPSSPSWIYIGSVAPGSPQGIRVVSRSFSLPSSPEVAVRANMRRKPLLGANTPSICSAGQYNDRDDLVFRVGGP